MSNNNSRAVVGRPLPGGGQWTHAILNCADFATIDLLVNDDVCKIERIDNVRKMSNRIIEQYDNAVVKTAAQY